MQWCTIRIVVEFTFTSDLIKINWVVSHMWWIVYCECPLLQDDSSDKPGVIYVGHIPRGFYEPQMSKYFSQFGKVNRLKLSRSKRVIPCLPTYFWQQWWTSNQKQNFNKLYYDIRRLLRKSLTFAASNRTVFRPALLQSQPNKAGLKCLATKPSVRTSVRSQKVSSISMKFGM